MVLLKGLVSALAVAIRTSECTPDIAAMKAGECPLDIAAMRGPWVPSAKVLQ